MADPSVPSGLWLFFLLDEFYPVQNSVFCRPSEKIRPWSDLFVLIKMDVCNNGCLKTINKQTRASEEKVIWLSSPERCLIFGLRRFIKWFQYGCLSCDGSRFLYNYSYALYCKCWGPPLVIPIHFMPPNGDCSSFFIRSLCSRFILRLILIEIQLQ